MAFCATPPEGADADALPSAASGRGVCHWWRDRGCAWPALVPAVRLLLALPAGNGTLERRFGGYRGSLTPQRLAGLAQASQPKRLFIRSNAPQLGIAGYPPVHELQPRDSGSEDQEEEEGATAAAPAEAHAEAILLITTPKH
jgi:hypothetical protein